VGRDKGKPVGCYGPSQGPSNASLLAANGAGGPRMAVRGSERPPERFAWWKRALGG
jgi:hypothetical protein